MSAARSTQRALIAQQTVALRASWPSSRAVSLAHSFSYKCKTTRNGICYTKGPAVETAYTGVINELRRSASRASGKGALISDGISAANSAAF